MNKYAFLSLILTLVLFFLQFIPIGIYFQLNNPLVNSYTRIPIQLFTYEEIQIFFWGILSNGTFRLWFDVNFLTGIFFLIFTPIAAISNLFGFWRENKTGKRLVNANFVLLLIVLLYSIIGIPVYSDEIIGIQFEYFDIFYYLNYGFFILLINVIIAGIGYIKHPIQ